MAEQMNRRRIGLSSIWEGGTRVRRRRRPSAAHTSRNDVRVANLRVAIVEFSVRSLGCSKAGFRLIGAHRKEVFWSLCGGITPCGELPNEDGEPWG